MPSMPAVRAALPFLLTLTMIVGCERTTTASGKTPIAVRVQTVQRAPAASGEVFSVILAPNTQVNLSFEVGGYVEWIAQVEGTDGTLRELQQNDPVTKNTVLARVQQTQYRDEVTEARANLAKARAGLQKAKDDFRRARNLYATQSITQRDYDQARKEFESDRADVTAAKAQLTDAQLNLRHSELKAPWSGVLLQRNIERGALATVGSVAFVLADVTSLKAEFGVPATALNHVQLGAELTLTTRARPNQSFFGTVTAIAPQADAQTRLFEIELTLANSDNRLKPGMIGQLHLAAPSDTVPLVLIPLSAVVRSHATADGYAVFVVDETNASPRARLHAVTLGDEVRGNRITVAQGLAAGQRIIVSGAQMVRHGEAIRIIP